MNGNHWTIVLCFALFCLIGLRCFSLWVDGEVQKSDNEVKKASMQVQKELADTLRALLLARSK